MSGLDIEAIRARYEHAMTATNRLAVAACASAEDVPKLLAEIERLNAEAIEAAFEAVRLRGELARTRAALGNVREHLDLRDGELVSANSQRDHARAALADALQVIADLRGGTS